MPDSWSPAAHTRSRQIEQGLDITFSVVFLPHYRAILEDMRPSHVLEVGGGTGHLARELACHAEHVTVVEPSSGMYSCAMETLRDTPVDVQNCRLEELDPDLRADLVIAHLCAHTVPALGEFMLSVSSHLASDGYFVMAVPHPAFYNDYKQFIDPAAFEYMVEHSTIVSFAPTLDPQGLVMDVPYVHRPISAYCRAIRQAGLCVTDMHEVFPPKEIQEMYGAHWESPRYLVITGAHFRPKSA